MRKFLAVLAVLPVVYVAIFPFLLAWWISVDVSTIRNPQPYLLAVTGVVIVHALMIFLIVGLGGYFIYLMKTHGGLAQGEALAWVGALVFFNILAYPFFYFFYARKALLRQGSSPSTG